MSTRRLPLDPTHPLAPMSLAVARRHSSPCACAAPQLGLLLSCVRPRPPCQPISLLAECLGPNAASLSIARYNPLAPCLSRPAVDCPSCSSLPLAMPYLPKGHAWQPLLCYTRPWPAQAHACTPWPVLPPSVRPTKPRAHTAPTGRLRLQSKARGTRPSKGPASCM